MSEVMYLCDGKACPRCTRMVTGCKHTLDISHAMNFEHAMWSRPGKLAYIEKEKDFEMGNILDEISPYDLDVDAVSENLGLNDADSKELDGILQNLMNLANERFGAPKLHLTPNDYQREALRTESGMDKTYPRILNGLMGLNGEAGECMDILKKHYFQGHPLDKKHLAEELGDVAWYLAIAADAIGYELEDILQMNVDKLRDRYPDGFEAERSMHREK